MPNGNFTADTFIARIWRRAPPVAVLFAAVGIAAFGAAMRRDEYRPLFHAERPGGGAIRSDFGPEEERMPPRPPPAFVKGIYVSAATAGAGKRFGQLVDLVDRTELNALVIDLKNDRGDLAFAPTGDALKPSVMSRPPLGVLRQFTAPLREKGIYLIARIFVFEDPSYAERHPQFAVQRKSGGIWHDRRGLAWVDPAAKQVWEYNAEAAKEAFAGGFDEVQFDYVRFPTDGAISDMAFPVWDGKTPKSQVIGEFFSYIDSELRGRAGMTISVDLFGLTMWQHGSDLNVGQRLAIAAPRFDYVSPMVYPSHYPPGWGGFVNPAEHPYDIVYKNLIRGKTVIDELRAAAPGASIAGFRPWIQDFDLGAKYTPDMVKAQMKASADGGATGWILWNARNVYSESALAPTPIGH